MTQQEAAAPVPSKTAKQRQDATAVCDKQPGTLLSAYNLEQTMQTHHVRGLTGNELSLHDQHATILRGFV